MSFKAILSALAFFSIAFAVQAQDVSEEVRLKIELFQIDSMLEEVYQENDGVLPIGVGSYLLRKKSEVSQKLEDLAGPGARPDCRAIQSRIDKLQIMLREQGGSLGRWGRDQIQKEINELQRRLNELNAEFIC